MNFRSSILQGRHTAYSVLAAAAWLAAIDASAMELAPRDCFKGVDQAKFDRVDKFVGGSLEISRETTRALTLARTKTTNLFLDEQGAVRGQEETLYYVTLVRLEKGCPGQVCLTLTFKGDVDPANFWGAMYLPALCTQSDFRSKDGGRMYLFSTPKSQSGANEPSVLSLTDFGPVFR